MRHVFRHKTAVWTNVVDVVVNAVFVAVKYNGVAGPKSG
jgi:hypothetical protein